MFYALHITIHASIKSQNTENSVTFSCRYNSLHC